VLCADQYYCLSLAFVLPRYMLLLSISFVVSLCSVECSLVNYLDYCIACDDGLALWYVPLRKPFNTFAANV